ncbi:unnamed protein product [Lasius platythorax]|uniref:Uncharacterized protein n=2 Tax=Lasius platythorax TaxID=488582 RepID=A0AAV2N4R9_9HYME
MKLPNSGLVCTRDFSSCKNKPKNILIIRKALDRICKESKRYFSRHSIMTKCKQLSLKKPPAAKPLCYTMIVSSPSCLPSSKLCPLIKKYITPSLSCHHESINLKCRSILSSPPRLVICPKSIKKLPSLKIYKKCPLLLKNLKLPSPSPFKYSKFSTSLKYPLKQKYLLQDIQEPCELYFPSYSRSYSSCSRSVSQYLQEICKNSLELRKNKEILTHRDLSHLISLHRVHWRGFHNSLFCLAKSNSDKSSACKKMDEICKSTEVKKTNQRDQSCNEKSDICRQKKVKCDKRQQPNESKAEAKSKPKTERKIVDPVCKKTCLARGKCEWPRTVPPPKMEYVKVTCLPPKFTKPNPCPSTSEHFQKDDGARIEAKKTNIQKKQICAPTPLPKPPFGPTALCPCLPPRKMHPGPCPCYERKEVPKPSVMQPCPLKKKYPCPTGIHYCPLQKKPCNLRQDSAAIGCEHKKKKETPAL